MTKRVFPTNLAKSITMPRGAVYTPVAGTPIDVPDHDADILVANGWDMPCMFGIGTTAQRPSTIANLGSPLGAVGNPDGPDDLYHDTTVGAIIFFDGATWRNAITGAAV